MDWFQRLGKKKSIVSIEPLPGGLGIAVSVDKQQCLNSVAMIESDEKISRNIQLAEFVAKHNLAKSPCYYILPPSEYQMLLVEAPEVADNELREAIRWKAKDLLTMPVEKAVVDVFRLPDDGTKTGKKMVYVVAVELDNIKKIISLVNESGLELESIEIEEMALRNLSMARSPDSESRGVAMVRLVEGGGSVSFYKGGNLYLARQFSLDYSGGLLDDLPADSLALEVQRSLDYYERQMGMSPPSAILICGENITEDKINLEIKRSLTVPAQYLDLSTELNTSDRIDEGMLHLCIGAIGGVFRDGLKPLLEEDPA